VERLPAAFDGLADRVTVTFPWGSLLRGALGVDEATTTAMARLVAPSGRLEIVASVVERDRPAIGAGAGPFGNDDIERITLAFAVHGLVLVETCPLTPAEIRATGSTWARRLRSDPGRPVWRVTFEATGRRAVVVG